MENLWKYFIFLCVATSVVFSVEMRPENSTGWCVKTVLVTKTRAERYPETYDKRACTRKIFSLRKCSNKIQTRYRTKIVQYEDPMQIKECCSGYLLDRGKCLPVCSKGCLYGNCIAPEKCSCNPGYQPDLQNNHVCVPFCSKQCSNGFCSAPETCICNRGYILDTNDKYRCVPHCSNNCSNGYCSAPNHCSCFTGYELSKNDLSSCVPVCHVIPENSVCIEPNKTSCIEGYYLGGEKNWECQPICSCHNGYCLEPYKCLCQPGFMLLENNLNICMPVCPKGCINGTCAAPNVCECPPGHKILETNGFEICTQDCSPDCINARCIRVNECKCLDQYQKSSIKNKCDPICSNCENGVCISPNICQCLKGYQKVEEKCVPYCPGGCTNGKCVSPNTCQCSKDYFLVNKTHCAPKCPDCTNGHCLEPYVCSCLPGYDKINSTICKPEHKSIDGKCLAGYEQNISTSIPKCANCFNGHCTHPNICICNPGYQMEDNICSPICFPECINGYCALPNTCDCFSGYEKQNSSNICTKMCIGGCSHGYCYHGNCLCEDNWKGKYCNISVFEIMIEKTDENKQNQSESKVASMLPLVISVSALGALMIISGIAICCKKKKEEKSFSNANTLQTNPDINTPVFIIESLPRYQTKSKMEDNNRSSWIYESNV